MEADYLSVLDENAPVFEGPSGRLRIVLVDTQDPLNLGAVARAMKNFGLSDLALVNPQTDDFTTARRVAVHAHELLERPVICASLDEAVADCSWVVGTSSRASGPGLLSPRQLAEALADHPGNIALVFGGEQNGLTNVHLSRCHAVSKVLAHAAQPSLNLAQTVILYAYECSQAAAFRAAPPAHHRKLTEREYAALESLLRESLRTAGFAEPDRPGHGAVDLMAPLRRAGVTPHEGRIWTAALRTLLRSARAC